MVASHRAILTGTLCCIYVFCIALRSRQVQSFASLPYQRAIGFRLRFSHIASPLYSYRETLRFGQDREMAPAISSADCRHFILLCMSRDGVIVASAKRNLLPLGRESGARRSTLQAPITPQCDPSGASACKIFTTMSAALSYAFWPSNSPPAVENRQKPGAIIRAIV